MVKNPLTRLQVPWPSPIPVQFGVLIGDLVKDFPTPHSNEILWNGAYSIPHQERSTQIYGFVRVTKSLNAFLLRTFMFI